MSTKSQRQPERAAHFHELEHDLPLAGTPAPLPCPFCGDTKMIGLSIGNNEHGVFVRVECQNCGAEAGGACTDPTTGLVTTRDVVMEACKIWNMRA